MGRYRIKINPNMDQGLVLDDWHEANAFLRQGSGRVLEIGSGLGEFLVELAAFHPDIRYLGLEGQYKRVLKATEAVWRRGLDNVRFLHEWADTSLVAQSELNCYQEIHINHPDPWVKKKQRKRRIVRPEMLEVFAKLLVSQGSLWLCTDHEEYAEEMRDLLQQSSHFYLVGGDFLSSKEVATLSRPATRFGRKLEQKGFPEKFLHAVRR